jgi:hypothetical protein
MSARAKPRPAPKRHTAEEIAELSAPLPDYREPAPRQGPPARPVVLPPSAGFTWQVPPGSVRSQGDPPTWLPSPRRLTMRERRSCSRTSRRADARRGRLGRLHRDPGGATTTQTGPEITALGYRGVKAVLTMTNVGTGSVTLSIQGKDKASGTYDTILRGAAVTTNVERTYTVYPQAPATANVSANDCLPATWRLLVTANNANPATYSVGFSTLA